MEEGQSQREILAHYKKFRVPESIAKAPLKELCRPPENFRLQPPQAFLEEFMGPSSKRRGILVFHKIGSGKTCTAIRIAEAWKHRRRIIVVVPAFLISNFYNELQSPCAGGSYAAPGRTPEEVRELIHKHYTILSYQKFHKQLPRLSLEKSILIIDEVQNMVSESGVFYAALYKKLQNAPKDLRIVILSATPIFDKPSELALTLNLLPLKTKIPTGTEFDDTFIKENDQNGELHIQNADVLRSLCRGFVSYYRGMPAKAFPKLKINCVNVIMSEFQYRSYRASLREAGGNQTSLARGKGVLRLPMNFFLGARITSNVAFPNGKGNAEGFASWKGSCLIGKRLKNYSGKFYKIMNRIKRAPKGVKIFVYSGFAKYGGIKSFVKVLEAHGYNQFTGEGKKSHKTFAVWSGQENAAKKDAIREAFNDPDSGLDILLGSPAIREGVSLKRVEQVHILEPYWNFSRVFQVLGRASRYCSHMGLSPSRRRVDVYLYRAVRPNEAEFRHKKKLLERLSVDRYISKLAASKQVLVEEFEKVLKEVSVDCLLNASLENNKIKCLA